ncbi:MAG: FUSC family protein [Streptosporangiaceae bacterium]|jgi:hypothetical protein
MTQLAKVFEIKRQGFSLRTGVFVLVVLLLPLIVLAAIGQEKYWLSVSFGALFVALSDPGGHYADRAARMAEFAVIGALLTALAFGVGDQAWGWVVLVAFVFTLLAGLAVKFGARRFAAGTLLNVWFIIALSLPASYHLAHIHTHPWAQALAWLTGSALIIALTCIQWLARGRKSEPTSPVLPGDTAPVELTRPVVLFAVLRAVALAISVAIAFGLHVQDADWMPIATIVAMKPSLQQSALIAEQRVAGTILGAAVAALFLLTVHNKYVLEAVIVVLGALAGSIRAVNYALYITATAGVVLIAADLPHPTNLTDEGRRVLFTFIGVGIAVVVMFLANLLGKRTAKAAPQATPASSS